MSHLAIGWATLDQGSMSKRASLNVSLTPELVAFVAAQVASGHYVSASEVVRTALRRLESEVRTEQPHTETVPS